MPYRLVVQLWSNALANFTVHYPLDMLYICCSLGFPELTDELVLDCWYPGWYPETYLTPRDQLPQSVYRDMCVTTTYITSDPAKQSYVFLHSKIAFHIVTVHFNTWQIACRAKITPFCKLYFAIIFPERKWLHLIFYKFQLTVGHHWFK